jgi:hypothetical protein
MMRFRTTRNLLIAALAAIFHPTCSIAQTLHQKDEKPSWIDRFLGIKRDHSGGWLFAASMDGGNDGVYFAISKDGYHWKLVNDGKPMLRPTHPDELTRDPFIQRAPDGTFRMAWTWSTGAPAKIGYSTSSNLLFWTEQRQLPVTAAIPAAMNASAPSLYYEAEKKAWLILWSSTLASASSLGGTQGSRIYATDTTEFKHFTPARVFFDPGYAVTGATLIPVSNEAESYNLLFIGDHGSGEPAHLEIATGLSINGPWRDIREPFPDAGAEAPAAIHVPGGYLLFYDHHDPHRQYGAAFSGDLERWSDVTSNVSLPAGMHHGSFLHLETSEYNVLLGYHGVFDSGVRK